MGSAGDRISRFPDLGRDAMLLMLTCAAGIVDAVSYLGLGRVFTAMMTGNTVLLALAISEGEIMAVIRSVLALAGFSAGAVMGALIVTRGDERGEWPRVVTHALAFEGLFLGVFTAVWHTTQTARTTDITNVLIVLSGLAMGIQSAAVRHLGVPGVATTYITGTLTSLVAGLVGSLRSTNVASSRATPADHLAIDASPTVDSQERVGRLSAVFLVYALGALVGGILQSRSSTLITVLPLVAVAVVVVNASVRYRHSKCRHP
jgi:uncharacterized membrane protein YoaK (UPF0700 family)